MTNIQIKCKECGNTFEIDQTEKEWYESKGWELPKRCYKCRKVRRDKVNQNK